MPCISLPLHKVAVISFFNVEWGKASLSSVSFTRLNSMGFFFQFLACRNKTDITTTIVCGLSQLLSAWSPAKFSQSRPLEWIFFENVTFCAWEQNEKNVAKEMMESLDRFQCFLHYRAVDEVLRGVGHSGASMTFCHVQYNEKLSIERCSHYTWLLALNHSERTVTEHPTYTHSQMYVTHGAQWTQSPWIWPSPVCLRRNSDRFPGTLWGSHYWVSQRSQNPPLSSAGGLEKGQIPGHSSSIWIYIKKGNRNIKSFSYDYMTLIF